MSNEDRYTYWRRWLYETAGAAEADRRIRTEARILRVEPLSDAAIRHAIATYQHDTGRSPRYGDTRNPATQEGLIP